MTKQIIQSPAVDQTENLLSIFKNEFSSTVIPVYIKSIDRTLNFREITVGEYKTFAKTALDNANRPATVFKAINSLITNVQIDKSVDINDLLDVDQVHILFSLCQTTFLNKPRTLNCPECSTQWSASVDVEAIKDNFASIDIADKDYTIEDTNRIYTFTVGFPTVRRLTNVFEAVQRDATKNKAVKRAAENQGDADTDDADNVTSDSLELATAYITAFIKKLSIVRKIKSDSESKPANNNIVAELEILPVAVANKLIGMLPRVILSSGDDSGIFTKITNDFISKENGVFVKSTCPQCGTEARGQIGSVTDFLLS
jgi:hypothetical protein